MNAGKQPILVVNQACGCTVTQVSEYVKSAGCAVVQSFDLLSAMDTRARCICQLVVLLIYGKDGPPATIILDGNDMSTSIFLENEPECSFRAKFITLLSPIAVTADANAESSNDGSNDVETQHDIRL